MSLKIPFYQDAGLLMIRLGLGIVFIAHGWSKWQSLVETNLFFSNLALPVWTVYLVIFFELIGGLAVVFGWLARFFSFGLVIIMIVAIAKVKLTSGFIGGYEFDFVLMLMALSIVLAGSGRYKMRLANWGNNSY